MKDVTVTSPLTPALLTGAGMAVLQVLCKHTASDPQCQELGWVCVPPGFETYVATGAEKHTPPLLVWPPGLQSVLLCRKVGSLLILKSSVDS